MPPNHESSTMKTHIDGTPIFRYVSGLVNADAERRAVTHDDVDFFFGVWQCGWIRPRCWLGLAHLSDNTPNLVDVGV